MTLESRRERADQFGNFVEGARQQPGIYSLSMRYAQVLCLLDTVWKSRRQLQEQNAQLRRGGRELGRYIGHLSEIALDVTGMHDVIGEDGDGDWGAVWENVGDLGHRASTFEKELRKSQRRVAELEAFVADIACHGLRTDLTPTFMVSSPHQYAEAALRYLRSADKNLRADARKFVPDADRPSNAGRPIPAPKVEIVADPGTELGVLLEQERTEGGAR